MRNKSTALCVCLLFSAIGCGNRGADLSDQINRNMVEKINAGEIRDMTQLENAFQEIKENSMKELGIDPKTKLTVAEKDALLDGIKEYKKEWLSLLQETWGHKTE